MMNIVTPDFVLRLSRLSRFAGGNDAAIRLKLHREQHLFCFELRDMEPTDEENDDAAEFLTKISGLLIHPDWLRSLLTLYPRTRIRLAAYHSVSDCEVRESLAFCLAHFVLGCSWPRFDEKSLLPSFLLLLHEEAKAFGLSAWECKDVEPFVIGFPGQCGGAEQEDVKIIETSRSLS